MDTPEDSESRNLSPGLPNPEVTDSGSRPLPAADPKSFQTHIPESRWLQLLSLLVVGGLIALWVILAIVGKH